MEMTTATQRAGTMALTSPGTALAQRLRDYVTLTKPHIISLLLVTTVTPMIVAAGGWPDGWTVLWTMLGGYLMAGSANATNMFVDRDIDQHMARTALRPIPSGRVTPRHGLVFAILLGVIAFTLFVVHVNLLAAVLSLAGWVWYVGVYTLRLKRTTPQNIVIGGAAGAFPPLVGWAAVSGELSATAIALFLLVFLWTPPHFWALALNKQKDYGRAGVPMGPNVWGERETIRRMVIYTWLLVPVTLAPVAFGDLGPIYAGLALLLGGWFLRGVYGVSRAVNLTPAAWAAYRRSLLYLALLFGAMALDTLIRGVVA
jgi:protoheme IX farnesyltransferase